MEVKKVLVSKYEYVLSLSEAEAELLREIAGCNYTIAQTIEIADLLDSIYHALEKKEE